LREAQATTSLAPSPRHSLDQVKPRIDLVGAVDIDVDARLAVERDDLDSDRTRKLSAGRGSRNAAHLDTSLAERPDEGRGGVPGSSPTVWPV